MSVDSDYADLEIRTWLGMIYYTYWTRLFFANDPTMVQKDVHVATKDAIAELEHLIDKHAELSRKRPEPGKRLFTASGQMPAPAPSRRFRRADSFDCKR